MILFFSPHSALYSIMQLAPITVARFKFRAKQIDTNWGSIHTSLAICFPGDN